MCVKFGRLSKPTEMPNRGLSDPWRYHIVLTWRPATFLISKAQSLPAILESPLTSVSRGLSGGRGWLLTQTRGSQDLCLALVSEEPAAIPSLPLAA